MKNFFNYCVFILSVIVNAQDWNLNGNSISSSNFLGTTNNQNLLFKTNNTSRMILTKEGTIGIGILSPNLENKLHINGKLLVRSSEISNNDLVDFVNDSPNVDNGKDVLWLAYTQYQPNNPGILTLSSRDELGVNLKRFTVRANGKVGIGNVTFDCLDCNNYLLFVKNGIKTERVKVEVANLNGWADYVFKENYNLMSIYDVESFIKQNGHLPNIPSAENVLENGGYELNEMTVKLLEKIEELTLYIIKQQKEIDLLKNDISNKK